MPTRFPFAFSPAYRVASAPFGVRPGNCVVVVDREAGTLTARYGPWHVETTLGNVAGAQQTGPYGVVKTIGPAHLSFADRGLTFASNRDRGVCISFREPVRGIEPTGRLRHPGLTVTVADCAALVAALTAH
jgi:hypothetical protein